MTKLKTVNNNNIAQSTKCLNSDNIESFYCCTNSDKSTLLFKQVLKAVNDEKWCGSAVKLFHGFTTLLLKMFVYVDADIYMN